MVSASETKYVMAHGTYFHNRTLAGLSLVRSLVLVIRVYNKKPKSYTTDRALPHFTMSARFGVCGTAPCGGSS